MVKYFQLQTKNLIFAPPTVNSKKMAKKKTKKATPKKSAPSVKRGRPSKVSSNASSKFKSKPKSNSSKSKSKKPHTKKRGRKPSVPNRYNAIKSAISSYYETTVGRKIKQYEMKIIYQWVKAGYANQSVRYIVMNIDVVLDNFWEEYCNLYPVEISNFARYYDWFLFKNYLNDEKRYHYPSDIIEVDLSEIGEPDFVFYMEDYVAKSEEYYEICKSAGIKRVSPPPALFLEDASCDITKRGNVYKYRLLLDGEVPSTEETPVTVPEAPTPTPTTPVAPPVTPVAPVPTEQSIEQQRLNKEYELKQRKLDELGILLRDKVITFEQYMDAVKML